MKRLFSIFILATALTLASCDSPMNKKYSETTYQKDIKDMAESNKIEKNDAVLLLYYIGMAKLAGKDVEGKTYKELLKDAQVLKAK